VLAYFQHTISNVENMIAFYNKLTSIVYVDKLVEPGFYIYYHLYDKVHGNYIKGLITKKQFGMFLD
jgi:folate-dependent tRNA-U54 methylase TrmFO/GidA